MGCSIFRDEGPEKRFSQRATLGTFECQGRRRTFNTQYSGGAPYQPQIQFAATFRGNAGIHVSG